MIKPIVMIGISTLIAVGSVACSDSQPGDSSAITWTPIDVSALNSAQQAQRDRAISARDAMFSRLFAELSQAMTAPGAGANPAGPSSAISVCKERAPAIAAAVGSEFGVRIGRTSDKLRNPTNTAPAWASSILAARPAQPAFAASSHTDLGVILPIKLAENCLTCHGPAESLHPSVTTSLAAAYPNDQATGYAAGDLRGWFWVEVPQSK